MATTPNSTKPATDLAVGDRIIVANRLARYLGRDGIEGTTLPVVALVSYDDGAIVGITLEGLPEVCTMAGAPIEVEA